MIFISSSIPTHPHLPRIATAHHFRHPYIPLFLIIFIYYYYYYYYYFLDFILIVIEKTKVILN